MSPPTSAAFASAVCLVNLARSSSVTRAPPPAHANAPSTTPSIGSSRSLIGFLPSQSGRSERDLNHLGFGPANGHGAQRRATAPPRLRSADVRRQTLPRPDRSALWLGGCSVLLRGERLAPRVSPQALVHRDDRSAGEVTPLPFLEEG